ncbi:MAG: NADH-quinone oxidoreductase subunit M [Alphaproteobacteria bacterium]|jgi:NADH-quinone oxidoreductase subunit M|nr:NADH-quinone oxidoreductase subunit M [Alphaproteobacteria bacterium]
MFSMPILSFLIFLPIVAILIILTIRGEQELIAKSVKYITILTSVIHLVLCLYILFSFIKIDGDYQFVEKIALIPSIDFNYYLGVDGISLLFLVFSSLLFLMIFLFIEIPQNNAKLYAISFLAILSFSVGTFASLDLILFYLFYEASMIPVFFLMGVFGSGNKLYSTFKFMMYTVAGSMLMIIAIIAMVAITKSSSMQFFDTFAFDYKVQVYLFTAIFIALAIKSGIFPFHSWLPDTYETSPLSLNIILSGVLMKYGVYGMIRILIPMFPLAMFDASTYIYILSIITLFYAGFIAFTESNIKKLFAYFSLSHLALIVAAIFSLNTQGIEGAIFQAISHSTYTAGIFLVIVYLKARLDSNNKEYFMGLATPMPILSIFIVLIGLANIGLPLTNGFVGEFLSLLGIFQHNRFFAILFCFTILISAVVIIRFNRYVVFGNVNEYTKSFKDINFYEITGLSIIVLVIIIMGVYPDIFLDIMHSSVSKLMESFKNGIIIQNDI